MNTISLDDDREGPQDTGPSSLVPSRITSLYRRYQHTLDSTVPHRLLRWCSLIVITTIYALRILYIQGWHIVSYALAIYLLNLFILFLSPKIDPGMDEWDLEDEWGESEAPQLPITSNQEFRPFIRRLPEFKFWLSSIKAFLIAFICTFFSIFNIPVFWPILVIYFIILFALTMKRQIRHMIRYRYLPFTHGKAVYKGKEEKRAATN
ncbi:Protein RER1-like isoform X1 [Oopsacas minuta]|uniref:Protein RER1 n=1 Tax=Oopsacas minuta TaxID=111878 RepID=A0AAV7JLI4_9METZ|nr:Protein RER1-like isoform X1 [Oopsacas minuta]